MYFHSTRRTTRPGRDRARVEDVGRTNPQDGGVQQYQR